MVIISSDLYCYQGWPWQDPGVQYWPAMPLD